MNAAVVTPPPSAGAAPRQTSGEPCAFRHACMRRSSSIDAECTLERVFIAAEPPPNPPFRKPSSERPKARMFFIFAERAGSPSLKRRVRRGSPAAKRLASSLQACVQARRAALKAGTRRSRHRRLATRSASSISIALSGASSAKTRARKSEKSSSVSPGRRPL